MNATVRAVRPVLVGVDGSGRNASAVAWAAVEASSSDAPLVLVHEAAGAGAGAGAGRATVERAAAQVARVDPDLKPRMRVISVGSGAVTALVQVARESSGATPGADEGLVVVGRRGAGGFARMALGSTARRLVHDPDGPAVVLVPTGWDPAEVPAQAPVVVDASPPGPDTSFGVEPQAAVPARGETPTATSTATITVTPPATEDPRRHGRQRALGAALARAQRDGRGVVAVSVWSAPADRADEGVSIAKVWAEAAAAAERDLDTVLAPWRTAYPEVDVVAVATDRHPVAALLDHAQDAELLVVPRGRPGRSSPRAGPATPSRHLSVAGCAARRSPCGHPASLHWERAAPPRSWSRRRS